MTKRYATPAAFKEALEARLRAASAGGEAFARRRQRLVFDRFLARVDRLLGDSATLKGGLVLELRLARARATKDVDLRLMGLPDAVLDRLQEAGRLDLGDYMTFEVRPDAEHPEIVNDGAQYDGWRFRTECRLAGKVYGRPFGVDVALADPILGEPDIVVADDVLAFAGIEPPTLRLYPVETHLAEKLHAYTLPRSRPNTRIKDLPDFALLASTRPIDADRLRTALRLTFAFRKTHDLPTVFPDPPPEWSEPYARIAATDGLPWTDLSGLVFAVRVFLEPVLGNETLGVWNPDTWTWGA